MNLLAKLSIAMVLGSACAACSNNTTSPAPGASAPGASAPAASGAAPAASAIPMQAPASGSSSERLPGPPPAYGPTLEAIMQRPTFAKAFDAMDGSASLPAWVKQGGVSSPSKIVEVEGKTMWLSHVCRTADCQGGQLFLLTDPAAHAMHGLFVETSGGAGASVQQLTWLGKPDAATRAFLKDSMAHD